ncbi:MAG: DUF418 domain-containing protein [Ardenticatenaceae bacterium]
MTTQAPVARSSRIIAIDALRGFALLGILLMNIQSFAMIRAAYNNPTAYGDLNGMNLWVWIGNHIFADQKFMTIFSLLFGAGIVLMSKRIDSNNQKYAHYRRMFWLLIIGMLHGYLLWSGDILVMYAVCGSVVFLFRKTSPRRLVLLGLLGLCIASALPSWLLQSPQSPPSPEAIATMIEAEVAAYQGSWLQQMKYRVPHTLYKQTLLIAIWGLWRAGGLMLIGMALVKWEIITAKRSLNFYLTSIVVGFTIGLPLIIFGINHHFANNWAYESSIFNGHQFNYWGSLFVSAAYIGIIMQISQVTRLMWLRKPLAAVGRMALTNYLVQTIICTFIFYGHGLALFGTLERTNQLLIVLAVWLFQITTSVIWLRYFQFGPFEWVWRVLTYQQMQPLRQRTKGPSQNDELFIDTISTYANH